MSLREQLYQARRRQERATLAVTVAAKMLHRAESDQIHAKGRLNSATMELVAAEGHLERLTEQKLAREKAKGRKP